MVNLLLNVPLALVSASPVVPVGAEVRWHIREDGPLALELSLLHLGVDLGDDEGCAVAVLHGLVPVEVLAAADSSTNLQFLELVGERFGVRAGEDVRENLSLVLTVHLDLAVVVGVGRADLHHPPVEVLRGVV